MKTLVVMLSLLLPLFGLAQEELNDKRKILKREEVNAAMSELVYKRLSGIHDKMGEGDLAGALDDLKKLDSPRLSKYERALLLQTFGFVYAQQSNEAEAIRYFEQSLATNNLPATAHQGMLYSLAGLLVAEGQYQKGIDTAREWFRYEEKPGADAFMLIGSSFAELQQFDQALPYILKAIETSTEARESWYMLAIAIYFQQQQFSKAADMLLVTLRHWPHNARYWEMLAACYLELEDDKRALDTMMLSYTNGMLTNPDRIRALAQLAMLRDMPYSAGVVLATEMQKGTIAADESNLKMLLQAWLSAREYDRAVETINGLEQYAADGEYFLQAAQIYSETGAWSKVVDNANKALAAGLKKPAIALLLAGSALTELEQFTEAISVFERVRAVGDAAERRNADAWIDFVSERRQLKNAVIGSR